jgi:YWFCY protein
MDNKRPLQFLAGLCCAGIMVFHAYYYLYAAFVELKLTSAIADQLVRNFAHFLFNFWLESKLIILFCLAVTSYESVKVIFCRGGSLCFAGWYLVWCFISEMT